MNLKKYYDSYWREKKEYSSFKLPDVQRRHRKLLKMLRTIELTEHDRVLDLGCGEAETIRFLSELGYTNIVGLDLSQVILSEAKQHCDDAIYVNHHLDFPLPFKKETFRIVLCLEVFEHMFSPYDLTYEIKRMLTPDGILICSVPYHGLFKNIVIALLAYERHYRINNPHIRFFTDKTLRIMLESHGLNIIEVSRVPSKIPFWPTNLMALCRKNK